MKGDNMAAETGEDMSGSSRQIEASHKSLEDKHTWLKRDLMDWTWLLHDNKTISLVDKDDGGVMVLDKVRLISFMKFGISALDKMRIEERKQSRVKVKKVKEKARNKAQQLRLRIRKKKVKTFNTRARIKSAK